MQSIDIPSFSPLHVDITAYGHCYLTISIAEETIILRLAEFEGE